jgi:N-acetylmuramoyl-L-alanine amidase
MRPYKVLIDPGHGGKDSGAVGVYSDVLEKDLNLTLARLVRRCVRRGDFLFSPRLTRWRDKTLSLSDRVKKAERVKPDLFVSLHCNSFKDQEAEGVEVFFKEECVQSRHLAQNILDNLLSVMPDHKNRGVKPGNLYVLRNSPVPAVLVEYEFLSNPYMLAYLTDLDNQWQLAWATAQGIEYNLEGGAIL